MNDFRLLVAIPSLHNPANYGRYSVCLLSPGHGVSCLLSPGLYGSKESCIYTSTAHKSCQTLHNICLALMWESPWMGLRSQKKCTKLLVTTELISTKHDCLSFAPGCTAKV